MLFAPRIAPRLLATLDRLARSALTPAEITRRLGAEAARCGLARPSYEQVRLLVRAARSAHQRRTVGNLLELRLDLMLNAAVPSPAALARVAVAPLSPLARLPRRRRT